MGFSRSEERTLILCGYHEKDTLDQMLHEGMDYHLARPDINDVILTGTVSMEETQRRRVSRVSPMHVVPRGGTFIQGGFVTDELGYMAAQFRQKDLLGYVKALVEARNTMGNVGNVLDFLNRGNNTDPVTFFVDRSQVDRVEAFVDFYQRRSAILERDVSVVSPESSFRDPGYQEHTSWGDRIYNFGLQHRPTARALDWISRGEGPVATGLANMIVKRRNRKQQQRNARAV